MDKRLKEAYNFFYSHDYYSAKKHFTKLGFLYEAGLSSLLMRDCLKSREFFEAKAQICTASSFGLIILDILEGKQPAMPKYFQIRSFLEIYINLLIENKFFDWAQKIIDAWEFFTRVNIETPKFIARVLNANNYNKTVHSFAQTAKKFCFCDAEIHYIEASLYLQEGNIKNAKTAIEDCISFAPEYYPVLKLQAKMPPGAADRT